MMGKSFDAWVAEALEASFSGWDFSWLADRWITSGRSRAFRWRLIAIVWRPFTT